MLRTTLFTKVSLVLTLVLSTACDKAADEQKKAVAAQDEAEVKITSARVEADKKIENAQSEADKKVADAQANFMKMREEFRHKTNVNLVDLDHKVELLAAKAKTSTGKAQTTLDANLKQIRTGRAEFAADYLTLDNASASTWDAVRVRLDKEWTELKTLVDGT
jgi:hypothetical protein